MVNEPRLSSTDSLEIRGTWKSSIRVLTSWVPAAAQAASGAALMPQGRATESFHLLRIQLDDQLLLHRCGDLAPFGLAEHLRRERVVVGLEPRGHLTGQLG